MQECKLIETQTFYQATERIKVDVPVEGIIYADNKDITIVPQVVRAGPNNVVAIRNAKLVTVQEGTVVGIVVPFTAPLFIPAEPEVLTELKAEPGTIIEVPPDVGLSAGFDIQQQLVQAEKKKNR